MFNTEQEYKDFLKRYYRIESINNLKNIILYGAAVMGRSYAKKIKDLGIRIKAFSDSNKNLWGRKIEGILVIPPSQIKKDDNIIVTSRFVREIYRELFKMRIINVIPHFVLSTLYPEIFYNCFYSNNFLKIIKEKDSIEKAFSLFEEDYSKKLFLKILKFRTSLLIEDLPFPCTEQYYPSQKIWPVRDDEVYVDVGAYCGDTLETFLEKTKHKFKEYIAIEPDSFSYKKLKETVERLKDERIKALNIACAEKEGLLFFRESWEDKHLSSSIVKEDGRKVIVKPLDKILEEKKITSLKIDVEGFEEEVLKGAKKTIKNNLPKIAVCVYHRPCHLWNIPLFLHELYPGYKFFLRHHEEELYGTVLYVRR